MDFLVAVVPQIQIRSVCFNGLVMCNTIFNNLIIILLTRKEIQVAYKWISLMVSLQNLFSLKKFVHKMSVCSVAFQTSGADSLRTRNTEICEQSADISHFQIGDSCG